MTTLKQMAARNKTARQNAATESRAKLQSRISDLEGVQAALLERERNRDEQFKAMERTLKDERDEHNRTRGILMSAELSYAKLRGFVEAIECTMPPVMRPETVSFGPLASMPDASQGTGHSGSAGFEGARAWNDPNRVKPWYYR